MRGGLDRFDQSLSRDVSLQPAEFLRGDDDDFVATVNGDVLGSFAADLAHQFAEACLRVLQEPIT